MASSMDLGKRLEEYRREQAKLSWEGTFTEYFNRVIENPSIARLSHARMYDMIMAAGVETNRNGDKIYNFFSDESFGLHKPLQQLVDYFSSAARRLEVRKRILLLMGPVGGGKSTIVTLLKRGLEDYTRTDNGAVYAIKGCPMHEEPLHLIPEELRDEISKEYGIYIEGELCPVCRHHLANEWNNRIEDVRIQRISFTRRTARVSARSAPPTRSRRM